MDHITDQDFRFVENFYQQNVSGLKLGGAPGALREVVRASHLVSDVFEAGGLVVTAGNGGSMADAMHVAEELSGKYRHPRRALRAVALSDPTFLTCVGNDFGFENVFARGCEALMRSGDCAIMYSTSGSSINVLRAAEYVKTMGGRVIAITGCPGSPLSSLSDVSIAPESAVTTEIAQLIHTMWTHMLIELVEKNLGLV